MKVMDAIHTLILFEEVHFDSLVGKRCSMSRKEQERVGVDFDHAVDQLAIPRRTF